MYRLIMLITVASVASTEIIIIDSGGQGCWGVGFWGSCVDGPEPSG